MSLEKLNTNIHSSPDQAIAWNGTAANYDILENSPGYSATAGNPGKCCRAMIVANPAGSLVYVNAAGKTVTVPQAILQACPYLPVAAQSLVAVGSGNAYVMVLW